MTDVASRVRRASEVDWAGLRAIRLESLADTPEAYGSTYEESATWTDGRWRKAAAHWTYFLAEREGKVVGMVSGGLNDAHPGTHWLYGMYVTPSERGTGIATRLVDAVVEWARARGATQLHLHVTGSVSRARAFYEKVGFVATGEVLDMDRDRSITLHTMVRDLG